MDRKLTLKLDSFIIEQAKTYARQKNISLSKLIELYLGLLVDPEENDDVTPFVKSLSGILHLPEDKNQMKDYKKHLLDKYAK